MCSEQCSVVDILTCAFYTRYYVDAQIRMTAVVCAYRASLAVDKLPLKDAGGASRTRTRPPCPTQCRKYGRGRVMKATVAFRPLCIAEHVDAKATPMARRGATCSRCADAKVSGELQNEEGWAQGDACVESVAFVSPAQPPLPAF